MSVETRYLYKYFPPKDYALDVIAKGTIKFSDPFREFNDTFDSKPHLKAGSFDEFVRFSKKNLGIKRSKGEYRKIFDRKHNEIFKGTWSKNPTHSYGVLCLTRNPNSLLMWAHYAQNHEGFLVAFKFDRWHYLDGDPIFPMPINYANNRPSIFFWESNEIGKWNLTKGCDWAYEQEERIIIKNAGIHSYDRASTLIGVVAGSSIRSEYFERLKQAVQIASKEIGRDIPLSKATLSEYSYEVCVPELF